MNHELKTYLLTVFRLEHSNISTTCWWPFEVSHKLGSLCLCIVLYSSLLYFSSLYLCLYVLIYVYISSSNALIAVLHGWQVFKHAIFVTKQLDFFLYMDERQNIVLNHVWDYSLTSWLLHWCQQLVDSYMTGVQLHLIQ